MPPAKHFQAEGYHTLTPYLYVKGAAKAIDFYKNAFGATEIMRMPGPEGRIMHAEIKIGDSIIMLADENPQMGIKSPQAVGGTTVGLMIYVPEADAAFNRALSAGAKTEREMADQFYGDRSGTLIDPFGHRWTLSTHVEDVSPEEMKARMAKLHA